LILTGTALFEGKWTAVRQQFEQLLSRFDLFLRRRNAEGAPSKGIIIADPHKAQLSKALQRHHAAAQAHGNRWSTIYNLIETIFFLASHESPGLQLADLFAYAVWRLVTANDLPLAKSLADCCDREPLTSSKYPGKWHGVKCLDVDPVVQGHVTSVWS
jgi:hypothetical protein